MFSAKIYLVHMMQFLTWIYYGIIQTEHSKLFQLFLQVNPDENHSFSSQRSFEFYYNSSQIKVNMYTYISTFSWDSISPNKFYRYSFPFLFLCLFIQVLLFFIFLETKMELPLASNSWSSCVSLRRTEISGVSQHHSLLILFEDTEPIYQTCPLTNIQGNYWDLENSGATFSSHAVY